ncbi:hypothetical protein TLA_TLA_01811 [Tessaracoccus lapidicaptus]|nr:hypothetical protein TLA_TLA_01811 [Tessaracoccus lapidicaptus]
MSSTSLADVRPVRRSSRSRPTSGSPSHVCATGCAPLASTTGLKPGTTATENAELREAKKRIRLLEQENEVLRRAAAYLSQANLPGK